MSLRQKLDILLVAISALTGFFAFPSNAEALILLIPVLWVSASGRASAFLVVLAYNLSISCGLISGAAVFLSETHTATDAVLLWFLMGLGISLPFLLWSPRKYRKLLCMLSAVCTAYILPPAALIGVVNPLTAAGCLFPGWGWLGIFALCCIFFLCVIDYRFALVFMIVLPCAIALGFFKLKPSAFPEGFLSIDTNFSKLGSGSFTFCSDYDRARMVFDRLKELDVRKSGAEYILLPETIAGRLNRTGLELWTDESMRLLNPKQKLIFGAELPTESGKKYDNVAIVLSGDVFSCSKQRIPVPYSMYRGPFSEVGANLHLLDSPSGILELPDGRKAAVIICYEAYLTLPFLLSFLHKPDLIVWIGNQWWCKDTSLPLIQKKCVDLWAQLFDLPVVGAVNR